MVTADVEKVAVVDLLSINIRELLARRFSDQVAQHAPAEADRGSQPPRRVVLIDRARDLTQHYGVFEHIFGEHVRYTVLCLAVGELTDDGLLHRPDPLAREDEAATLWVGDPEGVAWGMETSVADAVYSGGIAASYPVPPALLDALGRPAVFDEVVSKVKTLSSRTAAVGMRAARVDVSPERFGRALTAALTRFTTSGGAWTKERVKSRARGAQTGREIGPPPLRAGGRVDQDLRTAQTGLTRAEAVLEAGRGAFPTAVSDLVGALKAVSEDVERAIEACDPLAVPDPAYRQTYSQLGLDTAAARRSAGNPDLDALDVTGLDFLAEHGPLSVLADRYEETANHFGSAVKSSYLARLQRVGLGTQAARLAAFRADAVARPTAVASAFAATVPFATVLCTGSAAGGAAVAVAGFLGASAWVRHRLIRIGLRSSLRAAFARQSAVAGAGTAVGAATSWPLGWALWPGPTRFGIGTAVAVALAVLLGAGWSRLLVGRIRGWLSTEDISNALTQARDLIGDVVRDARWQSERNYEVCNYARVLRTVVSDIRAVLAERVRGSSGDISTEPPPIEQAGIDAAASRRLSERISEVDSVVLMDVGDVVAAVFQHFARAARAGERVSMPDSGVVRDRTGQVLEDYLARVRTTGVHGRPPGCRDVKGRDQLVAGMWGQADSLPDLVSSQATDRRITQFCMPQDLSFLDADPTRAVLVRFAPQSTERLVGEQYRGDTRWTEESRLLGVLRLVPLRPGVVTNDLVADGSAPRRYDRYPERDEECGRVPVRPGGGDELEDFLADDGEEDN